MEQAYGPMKQVQFHIKYVAHQLQHIHILFVTFNHYHRTAI
jgi:hypothetical protein